MVYPRLLLFWTAILCYAVNADPLAAPAATSRVFLITSSSTTTLQQQYAFTAPPTILLSSSSSDVSDLSSGSSSSVPKSAATSPLSIGSEHIAPSDRVTIPTTQGSSNDAENGTHRSLPKPPAVQQGGGGIGSESSPSTSAAIRPSDGKGGATPPGIPLKSPGNSYSASLVSAPSDVGPTIATDSTTFNVPTPPSVRLAQSASSKDEYTLSPPPPIATANPYPQLNNTFSVAPLSSQDYNSTSTNSHSAPYLNITSSYSPTPSTSSTCTPYTPGETITVFSIVPNTNTITITLYGNQSDIYTTTPEFTPPPPVCPETSSSGNSPTPSQKPFTERPPSASLPGGIPTSIGAGAFSTGPEASSTSIQWFHHTTPTTTVVVTSKNPVTSFTKAPVVNFPGGGRTRRQSARPTAPGAGMLTPPPLPPGNSGGGSSSVNGFGSSSGSSGGGSGSGVPITASPTTVSVGGVVVVAGPTSIQIGRLTLSPLPQGSSTVVSEGGQTFTVNPSQVIGPGTVIAISTTGGGVFREDPTSTVVDGITVSLGNGAAVIGGSTFAIGAGAPEQTLVTNKETISIGPGGVGFADMTITPPAALPTNVVLFDGQVFSAVGASVAVFDGSSITYTGGAALTTEYNGETITIGSDGVVDGTSTLGGPNHPTGTQLGIAGGIGITEIGSTIAVIDGTALTVGPDATVTTAIIDGRTITATSSGLIIDGSTTLKYPFNPTTQTVTAGGITFSEIGPSLVDIGGTTFTIGPDAIPTTDMYDGETISIGPGGIGFATTTITSFTTSDTAAATSGKKKKNGGVVMTPYFGGIWGACIAFGVGLMM